jgi:hypothetical protein
LRKFVRDERIDNALEEKVIELTGLDRMFPSVGPIWRCLTRLHPQHLQALTEHRCLYATVYHGEYPMTLSFLWVAITSVATETLRTWRFVVVVVLLSVVIVAGCDVRPFSEFSGEDNGSEESSEADDGEETDGEGDTASLGLTPTPRTIVTRVNTPGQTQIKVENPEADRTYRFATTQPTDGEAEINVETGLLIYTPDTDFIGSDSVVVTVTDDGEPPRSGTIEIDITVTQN